MFLKFVLMFSHVMTLKANLLIILFLYVKIYDSHKYAETIQKIYIF